MARTHSHWTVLPHGALEPLGPTSWTVTGELPMPLTTLERRMTVLRLPGDRLLIHNAIALDQAGMRALERLGQPTVLVVPSHLHRQDAKPWKERYPQLRVATVAGARAFVEQVVPVDSCEVPPDDCIELLAVAGTAERESALLVHESDGITLVLNDIVGNLPLSAGLLLRALGFASTAPRIPRMAKRVLVRDASALRAQLEAWSDLPLRRLVVAHGAPVLTDVPAVLRTLAASL